MIFSKTIKRAECLLPIAHPAYSAKESSALVHRMRFMGQACQHKQRWGFLYPSTIDAILSGYSKRFYGKSFLAKTYHDEGEFIVQFLSPGFVLGVRVAPGFVTENQQSFPKNGRILADTKSPKMLACSAMHCYDSSVGTIISTATRKRKIMWE